MDKDTRNAIERATQRARQLLEEDFAAQLEGDFDVHRDGVVAGKAGGHLSARQAFQRERIVAAIEHKRAAGMSAADSVADYLRDAAFTTLNRFVALKMLEARELVQECITKGEQSSGYREFCGMAPGLPLLLDSAGYRLYIELLFDELSTEVKVLFNRRDFSSVLWPRRACFEELLRTLNTPELSSVWGQDETIGWVYQYYNTAEERKKMRDESAAPRDSRELAVRNQFFTPRYVVEFLTDNTLGRLWYEMTRGETALRDRCRHLVRRRTDIFLKPGEPAPESVRGTEAKAGENSSREGQLPQLVHHPHRPFKDPREIRLLDPACGSMHFGLYAFDLLTVIYDEAWETAHAVDDAARSVETFAPFVTFAASFPDKAAFLREVPRLIVEHNVHGIDIDPRAVQIAGLSLWLRAQRAWHQAGVKPADRPRITRSNVVCAESMPGEKELLREFVEQQFPAGERPAFAFLLEKIFDRMTLAGQAGSVLRIEEDIHAAIAEARTLAQSQSAPRQPQLFPGDERSEQAEFDLRGLNDEQFWQAAEQKIYDALEAYAEQAEKGDGFQRRLFAHDAAQGFAFIDLCRRRYDVMVMNPPFGQFPVGIEQDMRRMWQSHANDIYVPFVLWASSRLGQGGRMGAITSRNFLIGRDQRDFRPLVLGKGAAALELFVDLGLRVLDGAEVDTATYVLCGTAASAVSGCSYWDFRKESREALHSLASLLGSNPPIFRHHREFWDTPANLIAFAASSEELADLSSERRLDPHVGRVTKGLSSSDDFRFLKLMWEPRAADLGSRWIYCAKGADYSWVISNINTVVDWHGDGELLAAYAAVVGDNIAQARRSSAYYFKPALTHTYRCDDFSLRALPTGCIFTNGSPVISPADASVLPDLLTLFLTRRFEKLLSFVSKKGLYETGRVGLLPAPPRRYGAEESDEWSYLVRFLMTHERRVEYSAYFVVPQGVDESAFDATACRQLLEKFASLSQEEVSTGFIDRGTKGFADRYATNARAFDDWLSYAVGCAFGRWDIRYATGERSVPRLPDPFAPLPVCPPGMLQGDDGLPLSPEPGRRLRVEGHYTLDVAWDGILVDDPEHPIDLERHVRGALAVLWSDRADELEHEACALLGVPTLREWFRRPTGFFADHLRRYSQSRRKAPIYWPLSTPRSSYTLWLYYHRLQRDSLYRCLELVKEKLPHEQGILSRMIAEFGPSPDARQRKELAVQEELVGELREFQKEVIRLAPLWNPNLNDGVIINFAPLWRLIAHRPWQKAVKSCWDDLVAGEYDWAHLAMHLWPERVVPKCAKDRSLAIAHGLEDVFWVESADGKWAARKTPTRSVDEIVRERTSPAVKAALKSLLEAHAAVGNAGRGRGGRRKAAVAAEGGDA